MPFHGLLADFIITWLIETQKMIFFLASFMHLQVSGDPYLLDHRNNIFFRFPALFPVFSLFFTLKGILLTQVFLRPLNVSQIMWITDPTQSYQILYTGTMTPLIILWSLLRCKCVYMVVEIVSGFIYNYNSL